MSDISSVEIKRVKTETEEDHLPDYFDWLPTELIELVVTCGPLELRDYCTLTRVSTKFKVIVDRLWKGHAQKRSTWIKWSSLQSAGVSWYEVCKECHKCEKAITRELDRLSKLGYTVEVLDEYVIRPLLKLPHPVELVQIMLNDILDQPLLEANLIHQHYGHYVYEHLIQQQLLKKLITFFSQPDEHQDWVEGAIIIAQWMQAPCTVDGTMVTNQINEIAQAVGLHILQMRGIKDSQNIMSTIKGLSLSSSAVIQSINEILYNQMKFTGNSEDYYNPNNSYIDKVLETRKGIPITLCCLYASVAKRLGLKLEPVNAPRHFLLKLPSESSGEEITYIDAFNRGRISHQPSNPKSHPELKLLTVYFRMLANLLQIFAYMLPKRTWHGSVNRWSSIPICSAISLQWELVYAAKPVRLPNTLEMAMHLAIRHHYYVERIVEVAEAIGRSDNFEMAWRATMDEDDDGNEIPKEKRRAPEMIWHIGMVMKHVLKSTVVSREGARPHSTLGS
ncbi:F-box only protein 21-like isoform X2 [Dysidea avara]|uniref:F-box only protein 21-like isoform X2 n=1 Tax=Dysidea avara TaxID=196820 RepID=UPI0033209432